MMQERKGAGVTSLRRKSLGFRAQGREGAGSEKGQFLFCHSNRAKADSVGIDARRL